MKDSTRLSISTGSWVRLVLVLLAAYAFYLTRNIIMIMLASIVIASAVEPAASWAKRKNLPRLPTVLVVYIILAAVFVGLFYFLLLPLVGETAEFLRTLPIYSESVARESALTTLNENRGVLGDLRSTFSTTEITNYLNSLVSSLSQGLFTSVSAIFGGVVSFFLIIVLSFYLAVQEDGISKFLRVITPIRNEKYTVNLWRRSQHKIGLWMQGQLLLAVIVMVLVYLGLTLIGIPHALLLAVLAGVFELIPLFGPILSAIPAIFVAFADGGTTPALMVAGLFLIIQQFENHLIYPLVVKKVVGVPPMVSILALLIGGQLAGFLGVLIAVPIAAAFMEFISDLEEKKIAKLSENESSS